MNESIAVIKSASIQVCNQQLSFSEIKPGESIEFSFVIRMDSDYAVKVVFDSGRELSGEVGYVTIGMDVHDVIHVKGKEITISRNTAKSELLEKVE